MSRILTKNSILTQKRSSFSTAITIRKIVSDYLLNIFSSFHNCIVECIMFPNKVWEQEENYTQVLQEAYLEMIAQDKYPFY